MNRKPQLASHRAARAVCAIAAAIVTWAQFNSVVSIAVDPPMAMAGHRGNERVSKSAQSERLTLAATAHPSLTMR